MAGDWIKMRSDLLTHPKVVRMSSMLKADRLRTIGALFAVWCLFDAHSEDGTLPGYTEDVLNDLVGMKGCAAAMRAVGWLHSDDGGLTMPEFGEHNGKSAKVRAEDSKRKRIERTNVREIPDKTPDKPRTDSGPEKRREEKKEEDTPKPPAATPDGFAEFWRAYPKKAAKPAAEKAFRAAKLNGHLPDVLADIRTKSASDDWLKDGGKFIPNPATYLNQRRWEDEQPEVVNQFAGAI